MKTLLQAGTARRDITLPDAGERFGDPLYVRTLFLDDGIQRFAILALDAVGIGWIGDIPNDFLARLRARIEQECSIPASHVLAAATHTHPSGDLIHCPPEVLLGRCVDSVTEAMNRKVAVTVASGQGNEPRFTMNRTLRLDDGRHWSVRHANPCPPDEKVRALGPLDTAIGILRLDRADGGGTLAVLFHFACHPLWADARNRISANYPGGAIRVLEEALPGATAIFLQGAAGDVIDRGFKNFEIDRAGYIEAMGNGLGLSTLKALRELRPAPCAEPLAFRSRTVRLPRRLDIQSKIDALEAEARTLRAQLRSSPLNFRSFLPLYLKYRLNGDFPLDYAFQYLAEERPGAGALREMDAVNHAILDKYLGNIRVMEQLTRLEDRLETFRFHQKLNADSGRDDVGAEINELRIGDFVLVTSPAEMLTQTALDLKAVSPWRNTFMMAYCNGYIHYGAPAGDYEADGYEVTECMLAPGWQQIYESAAAELLQEL